MVLWTNTRLNNKEEIKGEAFKRLIPIELYVCYWYFPIKFNLHILFMLNFYNQ